MLNLLLIILSGVIVYIITYPLIEWFLRVEEELEEYEDDEIK